MSTAGGPKGAVALPCGCTAYEHDEYGDCEVNPRWRDCHRLPDAWLIDRVFRPLFRSRWRRSGLAKAVARYALRHLHCPREGQCIFRAGHRGGCSWGADDDD